MILGRYILTTLVLALDFSEKIFIGGEIPYEGCSAPMFDVVNYEFKSLIDKIFKPEESCNNAYADKCLESGIAISSTH